LLNGLIYKNVCRNGIKQVQNLRKFVEFHFKPSLHEPRQWEIKDQCLKRWGFHLGEVRRGRENANPEDKFRIILNKVRCQCKGNIVCIITSMKYISKVLCL
jgi:hypothetical protein